MCKSITTDNQFNVKMKHLNKNFWFNYSKALYHCMMTKVMPILMNDERAVYYYYKRSGGCKLNLEHPVRFSEKLQWYKLHSRKPLMEECANKLTVRHYIKTCGYGYLLNDVLQIYHNVSEIDYDVLPNQFVLKGTHGSGMNVIVTDKKTINKRRINMMLAAWMHQDNYWSGREWVYKDMPRHIIAEKYLEDETGGLRDYKFYCFNGKPVFMQLEIGRGTLHNTRNFYDMDWQLLPFGKELPYNPNEVVQQPDVFDEMKKIATNLCKPFQYVRVDMYQTSGKIYFGELTFFPAGGAPDFVPDKYDEIVGNMWKLE